MVPRLTSFEIRFLLPRDSQVGTVITNALDHYDDNTRRNVLFAV